MEAVEQRTAVLRSTPDRRFRAFSTSGVLRLRGEVDVATAPALERALTRAEHHLGAGPLVVDLSRLEFLDCVGIGLLVQADERLRQGGRRLVVRPGTGAPARLLRLCRCDRLLSIAPAAAQIEE